MLSEEVKRKLNNSVAMDFLTDLSHSNEGAFFSTDILKEMFEASYYRKILPFIIVFFSDIERCFALPIQKVVALKQEGTRKSIPLEYFEKEGIEIETTKLRTNYKYNIEKFLEEY